MYTRFDLEQAILQASNISDDLLKLGDSVVEYDKLDKDRIANILIGLAQLQELKFDKVMVILEDLIGKGELNKEEAQKPYIADPSVDIDGEF